MGFLKKFVALVKGTPDWHEKYKQDALLFLAALFMMPQTKSMSLPQPTAAKQSLLPGWFP